MTVHEYQVLSNARRVLVQEYDGPPPANPRTDRNKYVDTIAVEGGPIESATLRTRTVTMVIRLDDRIPYQAEQLRLLQERMAATDEEGHRLITDIVPYRRKVLTDAIDMEAEIERRAAERAKRLLADELGEDEAEQVYSGVPRDKTEQCEACGKMFTTQGYPGHLKWTVERGGPTATEHSVLLSELELAKQGV